MVIEAQLRCGILSLGDTAPYSQPVKVESTQRMACTDLLASGISWGHQSLWALELDCVKENEAGECLSSVFLSNWCVMDHPKMWWFKIANIWLSLMILGVDWDQQGGSSAPCDVAWATYRGSWLGWSILDGVYTLLVAATDGELSWSCQLEHLGMFLCS